MLYYFKWNVKKINIYPFGGVITLNEDIDKPLLSEFIINLSGPLFQEILFVFILILHKYNFITLYNYNLFKHYNFSILVFNLLPIIPLDGYKLFNIILNKFFNFRISYMINIIISIIFLIIFLLIFRQDSSYYFIIIYLIYQLIDNYKNRHYVYNRFILEKKLKKSSYIKYKKIDNIKKMYRNKKNLIKDNGSYITEYRYTNKK